MFGMNVRETEGLGSEGCASYSGHILSPNQVPSTTKAINEQLTVSAIGHVQKVPV
jgi:hypothetical protein